MFFYFWNLGVNYVLHLVFGSIGYDLGLFGWFSKKKKVYLVDFFFFLGEKFNEVVSHITNTRLWLVKISNYE